MNNVILYLDFRQCLSIIIDARDNGNTNGDGKHSSFRPLSNKYYALHGLTSPKMTNTIRNSFEKVISATDMSLLQDDGVHDINI